MTQQPAAVYPDTSARTGWASGLVLEGEDFAQLNAVAKARGRKPDVVLVSVPARSWGHLVRPSRLQSILGGSKVRNVWSVPIVPSGESTSGAATGANASKWESFGKALLSTKNNTAVVRLDMGRLPTSDPEAQARAWRTAASGIKSVAPDVLAEWVVPAGADMAAVEAAYPGDDFVDMISVNLVRSSSVTWVDQVNSSAGLNDLAAWARSHSKTLSLNWSLGDQGRAPGADAWVQNVHDWLARQRADGVLAYETYGESRKVMESTGAIVYRKLF